jgi:hypothetical protein
MISSSIDQKNILFLIRAIIVIFDKMTQPNHTNPFISISRFRDSYKLMAGYIIIKPRNHNYYSRHNNYWWNNSPISRNTLYNNYLEAILWDPCIYLFDPN